MNPRWLWYASDTTTEYVLSFVVRWRKRDIGDAEALQLEARQGKRLGQCGCRQAAIECSREELQGHGVPQLIR